MAEFLNSIAEPDEISGINDKGDPWIMKFRNGGYFRRPTAAAGCRIFIEDGAKLRVVRVSNMQSGWRPFSSATIDVNYRDIVVPSSTFPLPPLTPCGGKSDAIDIEKRDKERQIWRRREKYLLAHKRNGHERKVIENAEKSVNPVRIGKEGRIARLN